MLKLNLPVPPSVNAAFVNRRGGKGRGRIKSRSYQRWLNDADMFYYVQQLGTVSKIKAAYRVSILLPSSVRGDIDNRIKLILDWLVSRELTPDDSLCKSIEIRKEPTGVNLMWVTVHDA